MAKFQTLHNIANEKLIMTHQTEIGDYEVNVYNITDNGLVMTEHHVINKPEHAIKVHQQCMDEAEPKDDPPLTCAYCGETSYLVKMQKLYDKPMCWHCFNIRVG
ncbi:MAG: hypothetical protein KKB31_07525 [Nanoarchaeota archaeon]|nr:hypothetical protein [Nanoarchaeota archaeon]